MKGCSALLIAAACAGVAFSVRSSHASAVSPVQKVVQMLTNMKVQGTKEKVAEQQVFKDYTAFKIERSRELNWDIEDGKALIEKLVASITKADEAVKSLGVKIGEVDKEIGAHEADKKAATELRDSDRAEFVQSQTDYTESLYALDHAIQMLKDQDYDRAQAVGLLQKQAGTMKGMRRVLAELALVQTTAAGDGAPAVAGYEFQSGGVVEMLEGLRAKFSEELGELEKAEMNGAHAYDMQMVHLTDTLRDLKASHDEMSAERSRNAAVSARDKGELVDTRASVADAEKFLSDLTATYRNKAAQFERNQEVRTQEIEALSKAIEIMSSETVAAGSMRAGKSLAQVPALDTRPVTFLQARSSRSAAKKKLAVELLRRRAAALGSKALAAAAAQAEENPFAKVVDMIENLLARLKEEAAAEADHKAYCDEELKKNKLRRDKMTATVARLHAEIEEKIMEIAEMAKEIQALAEAQAALRKSIVEATANRDEEKKENEATIKDAAAAQVAVKNAIAVLEEFYATQSFVQVGKQVPEMAAYKGMAEGTRGGVAGMLEVILSDFSRVETDTRANEEQAASEYATFMADSEADLERKRKAEFKLGLKKDAAEFDQEQLQKDLDATQEQLDMANAYYGELKPQCVEVQVSFEERSKMRQEEIEALKEAYKVLNEAV